MGGRIITGALAALVAGAAFAQAPAGMSEVTADGCKLYLPQGEAKGASRIRWSGQCANGFAEGRGVVRIYSGGKISIAAERTFSAGKMASPGESYFVKGGEVIRNRGGDQLQIAASELPTWALELSMLVEDRPARAPSRPAPAPSAPKQAEKSAEQQKAAVAEKAKEETRKADEAKKAEAKREADAQRLAEAKKQEAEAKKRQADAKAAADKLAAERAALEAERKRMQAETQKALAEAKAAQERAAAAEKAAKEAEAKRAQAEKERQSAEAKAAAERERAAAEAKAAAERKAADEKLAAQRAAQEAERKRLADEKVRADAEAKALADKAAADKAAADAARDRAEKERVAAEARAAAEKAAAEAKAAADAKAKAAATIAAVTPSAPVVASSPKPASMLSSTGRGFGDGAGVGPAPVRGVVTFKLTADTGHEYGVATFVAGRDAADLKQNAEALAAVYERVAPLKARLLSAAELGPTCTGPGYVVEARITYPSAKNYGWYAGCMGEDLEAAAKKMQDLETQMHRDYKASPTSFWAYQYLIVGYVDDKNFRGRDQYERVAQSNMMAPGRVLVLSSPQQWAECNDIVNKDPKLKDKVGCLREAVGKLKTTLGLR